MFAAVRRLLAAMPLSMMPVPAAGASAQPLNRPHDGPTSVQWDDAGERDVAVPTPSVEAIVVSVPSAAEARAPAAEPFTEFRVRPALDLTLTIGAAAPTIILGYWVERSLPLNVPTPGAEANVGRFDRVALGRFEAGPAIASDVLMAVSVAAPLVYHGVEAGLRRRGWGTARGRGFFVRYGTDLVIFAQTMAINGLLTQILKSSIARPRPYSYLDPDEVDPDRRAALERAQERFDADWSFPSGHTSTAFAASTAGATLLTIKLLGRSRWGIALAWVGGTAVATTTAAMRVLAGRHFPSDVVTSALLGGAVGAAVPLAHWRPPRPGDRAHRRDRRRWAVAPMGGPQIAGLRVWGALPLIPYRSRPYLTTR